MGDLYSILELPLILEEGQKNVIDKKIDCAKRIYNNMLSDNLKKYKVMRANGFSDFGFRSQVLEYSKYYQKHIPAIVARLSVMM